MADYCVVRNAAYRKSSIVIRERHNERKNENYNNEDIDLSRAHLNVHFKKCEGTYTEAFDKLVADGVISTRGLKQEAKVFDELVFDVNSAYFERHGDGSPAGSYDFARDFYADAYEMAVKEAGGEQYILSAVMHADERNKALSEQLGRDVYHYHLHVVYVPVVDKEIRWTKRCKDPALVGTVKEVIKQVSHSKKWSSEKAVDEHGRGVTNRDGRAVLIPSYSLLQDRYFEHMRSAGYLDVERGERGSTAQHLSVLDYKVQQENKRVEGLAQEVQNKRKQLSRMEKKIAVSGKVDIMHLEIDSMAKKNLAGKYVLEPDAWAKVSALAKSGITARVAAGDWEQKWRSAADQAQKARASFDRLYQQARPFLDAVKIAPDAAIAALDDVVRRAKDRSVSRTKSVHREDSFER